MCAICAQPEKWVVVVCDVDVCVCGLGKKDFLICHDYFHYSGYMQWAADLFWKSNKLETVTAKEPYTVCV